MQTEIKFLNTLIEKLLEKEISDPVVKPIETSEVVSKLNIGFQDEGMSDEAWEEVVQEVALHTPRTSSKLFFNQLFGGRQPKAVLGDLLAVILNNSMYTYKVAGPQAGIEKTIIQEVCKRVGYTNGDGTMPPGGSMSNFMGLVMARDAKDTSIKQDGVTQKMTLYTSATSHYSTPKNAAFAGVGRNNIRYIKNDAEGRMDPVHLEECIQKDIADGYTPFYINATAGTTVLGALMM